MKVKRGVYLVSYAFSQGISPVGFGQKNVTLDQPQREVTFGEKAVGYNFNPSGDAKVQKLKELYAEIIDLPYDKIKVDDVDTKADDHDYDSFRYGVMGFTAPAEEYDEPEPDQLDLT